MTPAPTQPVFYYDLASAECYLAAERMHSVLPVVPEWEPVLARTIGVQIAAPDLDGLTRRAREARLQPLRMPSAWPPDTGRAMLAATYAKHIGRAVAFSLAAFRQAFAGGRDLAQDSTVLLAAAACEMHPTAVLKAIGLRSVTGGLQAAGERALAAGVRALPAIQVGDELFEGPGAVENAALTAALTATR
jgi:2-hydroxychromene-2-carboxylate isomerase